MTSSRNQLPLGKGQKEELVLLEPRCQDLQAEPKAWSSCSCPQSLVAGVRTILTASFSLPSVFHRCLPLAEPDRKLEGKGAWEM